MTGIATEAANGFVKVRKEKFAGASLEKQY
jgi:hypothetical protein